ncbi:aminotransferase class-V family protein [Mycolicibacterium hassiacum DSM 44199]|jgi:selenocysteine lyase/cysteine desulfurase|uniref:Aminotransferase class-V family protein n=1 Tax=Mycolicibacterium hassiacum (strain DSM 44199 / CIP 105218 / JCM 12690 / 3849) TaxID=1122247 RepID=K5BCD5_MYCHD|nr:aminotransferase class V-fold PLP-dependent enzyme [Mycolicibacterium hassiacum]EKF25120.1 aminotransferase class-V family protein [Mycolicibacterium hassiacum DSM 44199]MBX5486088.1 aminotransferase class V-fold PLP-dependent enzyme [Mycolicibacterium hassiacum]MDA4087868.1 aminotransferase class V [Mycolicibacterium hassiacum DSM 44199]PZN18561.1 MAG: aminotransferase class V-fold PLP-dependent enzyme [Mycolicibacterium hassiacum]VCT93160.1 hercynylcysteine sulfoxide lyase [Mycolicibacter
MTRYAFGAEFCGADGFLNTPTYGLPPGFMVDALYDSIAAWQAGTLDVRAFDDHVHAARAAYAALVGVPVERVALGSTVSSALGLVAAAVPDGGRVGTIAGDFTSTVFPFAAQAGRGVGVTELSAADLADSAADFDVVVASLAQSATGELLDLDTLRNRVTGTDTLTVLDLTQALGWKRVELDWVDVTVTTTYKWLLSPRGTTWMSLSDRAAGLMTPHSANWFAGEDRWQAIYGLPLRLAESARRFDVSPAWFSVLGAALVMPWLAGLERAEVEAHTVGLADRLRVEFDLPPTGSAIVSLPTAEDPQELLAALDRAGIRAAVRAGAVRVGFHLYNDDNDLDRLVGVLRR